MGDLLNIILEEKFLKWCITGMQKIKGIFCEFIHLMLLIKAYSYYLNNKLVKK
jgi:hypothetical protein